MEQTLPKDVNYCGKSGWNYIGDDPDSGKPVLKDSITKKFIVADPSLITTPPDHKQDLLLDIEKTLDEFYEHPSGRDSVSYDMLLMLRLSQELFRMGYNDGTKLPIPTILGLMCECYAKLVEIGIYFSRGDFEITLANHLYENGIRKNKIVVADDRA